MTEQTQEQLPGVEDFSLKKYIQILTRICKDEFENVTQVPEMIRLVCSKPESLSVGGLVHQDGAWPRKDINLAKQNREDGNVAFQEGRFDMALLSYTEAMRYAPCHPTLGEGEELALAAANRSAAFEKLKQYSPCLEDIEMALSAGYPTNGLYKLYIRQCKCELQLGRIPKAQKAFDAAVDAIEWSGLNKGTRSDLTGGLQEAFIHLARDAEAGAEEEARRMNLPCRPRRAVPANLLEKTTQQMEREGMPDIFVLKSSNVSIPAASTAVEFKYEPSKGRHCVASRDIDCGDVLFVESPIVSTICDDHYEFICLVCLRYTINPLPCPTCSDASFCSLACRTAALATFHKWECKLQHVFQHTGIRDLPLLLLGFRAVTQKPLEYFVRNEDKFDSHRPTQYGMDGVYDTRDYSSLYNLCTHGAQREPYDIYTKTIFGVFLLRCLQEVGYFKSMVAGSPGLSLADEEVLVGRLLTHFMQCIQFNTHTIEAMYENRLVAWDAETRLWKNAAKFNVGDGVETVRIGGGVYPTLALVNHSCDPNFAIVFWGRVAIAVATRRIAMGEEINDNYGANYSNMELQEREEFLKKSHWFECGCKACSDNYPEYKRCARDYKKLPGSAFKFKRVDRQKLNRDVEMIKKSIKANVHGGNLDQSYNDFKRWSDLVSQLVHPPHQDFINIRKGIRNCLYQNSPNKCRAREDKEEEQAENSRDRQLEVARGKIK